MTKEEINGNSIMPYGRHKDKKLNVIPAKELLRWYDEAEMTKETMPYKEFIRRNLDLIKTQALQNL